MKKIFNNIIPFKGYVAINLFGVLFVRNEYKTLFNKTFFSKKVINHESIHTQQMKELLYIPFYIWYIIEYIIKLILCITKKDHFTIAYYSVCFEQEAKLNTYNLEYLNSRKKYNWLKYVFKLWK